MQTELVGSIALAADPQVLHREVSEKLLSSARTSIKGETEHYDRQCETENRLHADGFINMNEGGGFYALGVVAHPDLPKRVYKLVYTGHDSNDLYIDYAEWLLETRIFEENPHFPRIYEITYSEDREVALVVMEELREFDWDKAEDYHKDDYWLIREGMGLKQHDELPPGWVAYNRPITAAAKAIRKQFQDMPKIIFDMHKGNVMLRGDILVITDPIVAKK